VSPDDLILALQRTLDRLVRRLRLGPPPTATGRRLLIIQIDGLCRDVLLKGLATGRMPFTKRVLERHHYRLEPMSVSLPTSTAAFQMGAMYGVRPDIPGFHYYDRRRRRDVHFPRPGHAARVEREHAAGRAGILEGGSAYGCVFTGGAANDLFSFARLTRPSGRGLVRALSPLVVVGWVVVKSGVRTLLEVIRAVLRVLADPVHGWRGWRWLTLQIGLSVWVRGFFTLAASRDLYAGRRAVYVNYLDYDVLAHAYGPESRQAVGALRRVDRSIRQLWRVVRRVPGHRYDVYVLADHGQAPCRPFRRVSGGRRLERWILEQLVGSASTAGADGGHRVGLARGLRVHRRESPGLLQHFLNYLDEDFLRNRDPEAYERDGLRVIAAGPNAFLYVLDAPEPLDADALERRLPGLAEELSRSAGVGFVLARALGGPVCFWRGKRHQLGDDNPGPFAGRPDAGVVLDGIAELMAMPSIGDLVIYGIDAPGGHVSFIPERGAHAGPSPEEMQTFVLRPPHVSLPLPLRHPTQLYEHFIRYRAG
jgi:hypothetical protein